MYYNWPYSPDWTHISYDRHMIVRMTGIYTRLVIYARLHIWAVIVCFISSILLPADYHVISYLSLHFHSWLFCYHSFAAYRVIIYEHIVYMHEHFSFFLYIHWSLFDDPEFARPDIRRFIFIDQVFGERITRFTRS